MFYHALTGNGGATPTKDLEPVLLWENSNPSAEFAAQTISLDLTDYAGVLVEFNKSTAQPTFISRIYSKKGETIGGGCNNTTEAKAREITVNNTGVVFGPAINGGTNNVNNIMMPTKIYGVKNYVVESVIGDLLWTNPSPSTEFASQTINIDTRGYEYIKVNTSNESVIVNDRGALLSTDGTAIKSVVKSDNNILIGNTIIIATSAQDNTKLIPISIIGIKAIS